MRRSDWHEGWIDVKGIGNPRLLAHYARDQADEADSLAAFDLRVDRVVSCSKGEVYSARLTLSLGGRQTSIDESNSDEFLAVRDAFDIARLWLERHTVALDASEAA